MPLSDPVAREHLHTRRIVCEGYIRADGLFDIEAQLVDTKTYPFENDARGTLAPGDPLHGMWLRLTLDDAMEVKDVEAVTDAAPFPICGDITPAFAALKGLRIGPGWRGKVSELLGGTKGCTHLVELLGPLATVAFQTIWSRKAREKRGIASDARPQRKPGYIDGCHALASDGPIVRDHHPRWYTGPGAAAGGEAPLSGSRSD